MGMLKFAAYARKSSCSDLQSKHAGVVYGSDWTADQDARQGGRGCKGMSVFK